MFQPRSDCQIKNLANIYFAHFNPKVPGTFVEVGAFDGVSYSNTVFLAEMGWQGLYIEAHPEFAAKCAENHRARPNVRTLSCAVGAQKGPVKLYVIGECSSTKWDKSAVDWGGDKDRYITIEMRTLDEILETEGVEPKFDLLVIDVEQGELDVLAGLDLARWRPKMAIIETHDMDSAPERNWKATPIKEIMFKQDYQVIHTDAINTIFLRR
jgi:FkbM family methyltransferase